MIFTRKIKLYLVGIAVLLGLSILLYGCRGETGLKFSHSFHIVEQEATCDQCHVAGKKGNYSNPSMDNCKNCHDIDEDNPSEKCLVCHTVEGAKHDYEVKEKAKPKSHTDLIFSHEVHADSNCATCHKGVAKDQDLANGPKMPLCINCHKAQDGPQECSACHQHINAKKAPESHQQDWETRHGQASRLDSSCAYCHPDRQKFCESCHRTQKPRDHTFGWKNSGHGMEATHDRRLCANCHDSGYCVDCHRNQKPVSHHRAGWMSYGRENGHGEEAHRNFRSCNVCHETGQCLQCHQNIILRKQ